MWLLALLPLASAFRCGPNEALSGLSSLHSAAKGDRIFFDHVCRRLPELTEKAQANCRETLAPRAGGRAPGTWVAACSGDGFLAAVDSHLPEGGVREFRLLCCTAPPVALAADSCWDWDAGALGEPFRLRLAPAEVLTGLRSVYDQDLRDRVFVFTICSVAARLEIKPSLFSFYPPSRREPFGDAAKGRSYETRCVPGKFLRRLDSLWSPRNGDRALMADCDSLHTGYPVECVGTRVVDLDGAVAADGGLRAPRSARSGCSGQEAAAAWSSRREDGLRRHSVGCCVMKNSSLIMDRGCFWVQKQAEASFVLEPPEGHVIRGVGSTFRLASGDRAFEFELCPLRGFEDATKCSARTTKLVKRSRRLVMEVFMHVGVASAGECARVCEAHPFCLSAGFQAAPPGVAASPACLLSYRRNGECSEEDRKVPSDGDSDSLWLQCIRCPKRE